MGLLEQLQEQGWHLLPAGLERLLQGDGNRTLTNPDVKQVIKLALDTDLREIAGGALSALSNRTGKLDSFEGNVVVQIIKKRNISAPKANEESKAAPRCLKLTITDGQTQYFALEHESISTFNMNTPPGTKIFLKNGPIRIAQGLLLLNANNVTVLGGQVSALVEKWEFMKSFAKYAKGGRINLGSSGPPPWIAFGQKIQQNLPNNDKNFKSLQTKEKDDSKENAEFNALRNDAIAEANKLGTKKTFGGGAKQMVDANVQKVMDKGFTEEQATYALKTSRNNVQQALSNLQRSEDRRQAQSEARAGVKPDSLKPGRRGFGGKKDLEPEALAKPSTNVSLFDYLEEMFPPTESAGKKTNKDTTPNDRETKTSDSHRQAGGRGPPSASGNQYSNRNSSDNSSGYNGSNSSASKSYNQRFENNISSSFANRNTTPMGGGSMNHRGGGHQQSHQSQSNYKQSLEQGGGGGGGGGGRYRGNNDGAPRGGRADSKYNQSQPSYNQTSQRNDAYNNNNASNANSNAGHTGPGSKYGQHNGGKPHQTGSTTTAGYGYGAGQQETRNNARNQNAVTDNRNSGKSTTVGQGNHFQSQNQSSFNAGTKGSQPQQQHQQNANAYGNNNGNNSNNSNSTATSASYNQQNASNNNSNNYGGTGSGPMKNPSKNARYAKEESQKYAPTTAAASGTTTTTTSQPSKKPPPKMHNQGPQQQQQQQSSSMTGHNNTYGVGKSVVPPGTPAAPPSSSNMSNNTGGGNKGAGQLTEAVSNLQISGNSKPFASGNNQMTIGAPGKKVAAGGLGGGQTLPPQVHTGTPPVASQVTKGFLQMPNGFTYNPYHIVGFQNKHTNEFALNVLKSQQFDPMQPHTGPPSVTASMPAGVPMGNPVGSVVPPVLAAATAVSPAPQHLGLAAPNLPNWKIGDRCLAKYWEDGGFYSAEITGISENTFVVHFLEYGNFEEVLKTDCLPVTAGPVAQGTAHGPVAMGFHHAGAPPQHVVPPSHQYNHHPMGGGGGGGPVGAYAGHPAADSGPPGGPTYVSYEPHANHYAGHLPRHHHQVVGPPQTPPGGHGAHQQQQQQQQQSQQRPTKFREQRPMYVPPAQRK